MSWLDTLRGKCRIGKAIPDVVEPKEVTPSDWEKLAIDAGRLAGRIGKGNGFTFSLSMEGSSATVPEETFKRFVAAGVIDGEGKIQPDPRD